MRATFPQIAWLLLAGCAASPDIPTVMVSDSGGVRIVEYPQGPQVGPIRQLDTDPIARIGEAEGDPAFLFSRVAGARELDHDMLVVADATSRELRWFGLDGAHRLTAGRAGEGPGEFGSLTGLHRMRGDTLIAIDAASGRPTLSWFSPDGRFVSLARPGNVPDWGPTSDGGFIWESATMVGAFEDGDLLAHGNVAWPDVPTGVRGDSIPILRYDRARDEWVTLGHVGGFEVFIFRGAGSNDGMPRPFGYWPRFAAGPDWYAVGSGDDLGISVHDQEGVLTTRLRHNLPRPPVTDEAVRRERDASLEEFPHLRLSREALWRAVPIPQRMPSHGPVLVGGTNELWVRSYMESSDGLHRWYVFMRTGEFLLAVDIPVGIRLHSIGDEHLIAVQHDEFDVPEVLVYRRPGR